eukprot:GHUV01034758.1.p1 GENE.GHUV01034758.1~~GHUV01034758.1.p1  ORF type:complete len:270 (-),score=86.41 GHUV01034758.1:134-943(-)
MLSHASYRMLEESWRAVKPAMQDLLRSLPKRLPQLASDVSAMTAQVKNLDDSLEAFTPAAEVWQMFRQILAFYSHHGKFVDVTPTAASAGSATPRALVSAGADGSGSPLGSPRGFVAAADAGSMSGVGFGGFDSAAGTATGSFMGGPSNVLTLGVNSRPGSPAIEPLLSTGGSTGLDSGSRPVSGGPRLSAVSTVGSRPSSPAVAAAVASGAASPAGSRPSSAEVPGLRLPLVGGLVRPGSALSRPASSPRGASGKLSGSRPASAAAPR